METLKKESNQRVGVCNVLAESHGNVMENAGRFHGKSWKTLELSMESPGNRRKFPQNIPETSRGFLERLDL
jgi:hypothetical protein